MKKTAQPQPAGNDDITSERHLYRDYPLTQDDIESAIENDLLHPIYSASGGRFFRISEIEHFMQTDGPNPVEADEIGDEMVDE